MTGSRLMPLVYRWLLVASGVALVVVGWADGRLGNWGFFEQVLMVLAGLFILLAAFLPLQRTLAHTAAYLVVFAGLAEIVNQFVYYIDRGPRFHLANMTVWMAFTAYTVLLVAFGWVGQGPE